MSEGNPKSSATIGGHPLHALLIPFPIVSFIGALVTDVMYLTTREAMWASGSAWLLGIGLVTALLAGITGFIDYLGDERIRRIGAATRHMVINLTVMVIETVNLIARLIGGSSEIAVLGVWLSLAAVALLIYSGWLGGELVYKHRVGVAEGAGDPAPLDKFTRDRR